MTGMENAHKILYKNLEGKLVRPKSRYKDNIKMHLRQNRA
jgi:hypothetical protein